MIEMSDEASDWVAKKGYDEHYGARPLARVIQEHIKKPLAEELLFGVLKDGGTVRVDVILDKEGKKELGFEYLTPEASKPTRPKKPRKKAAAKAKTPAKKKRGPKGGGGTVPRVPLTVD